MRINRTIFGMKTSWLGRMPKLHHRVRTRYLLRHANSVPVGQGILCRVLGVMKIYADPDDRDISPHLIMDGYWEPRVTEAIVDRVRPGMMCVDVGANLGYFSLLMASLTGPRGHVLAFEPNPVVAERFSRSLWVNGLTDRVTLHRAALSDEGGQEMTLVIPPFHPGGAHIVPGTNDNPGSETVPTMRLDEVPRALEAVMVKIDAEGMEPIIWRGMAAMIAGGALRFIVLEFAKEAYADPAALLDEAIAAGFSLYRIDDNRGVVPTTRDEILSGHFFQMLLLER
jgi:FkbM family methyltransferase